MIKSLSGIISPDIRAAMADAVHEYGLRAMAREVAMSPSGLRKFTEGGEPYRKTRHRLENWYRAWGTAEPVRVRDEAALQLVRTFPPNKQGEVRRALSELLARYSAPSPGGRKPRG